MTKELRIRRPDDWHLHLRDGAIMRAVLPESARHFARAIIMPNLVPPVARTDDAAAYLRRITDALAGARFTPLMTLYLTEETEAADVATGAASGLVRAVKLYPAGATTNSQSGVREIGRVLPVLEKMAEIGLPLLIHGEVTAPEVDIFDREAAFIDRVLVPLRARLPELRIVLEHVTTADGVAFVAEGGANIAGTITAHHLILNRNALLVGGIRPHYYCLPIAKRARHRDALRKAATGGGTHFFLGTDSAPHVDEKKECACGCAGCFTAPNALSLVAQVFEEENALPQFESFVSLNGADFYHLSRNEDRIRLIRQEAPVHWPTHVATDAGPITVFDPGFPVFWRVADDEKAPA